MNTTDPNQSAETPGGARSAGIPTPTAAQTPLKPAQPEASKASLLADWIARLLGSVARFLDAAFVEQSMTLARKAGLYAILAGAGLTLIYAIVVAVRLNQFTPFLAGLGMVIAIAVTQFAAQRFLHASDLAIANAPSVVASPAFLECTGLLSLLLALLTLIGGVVSAIELSSSLPLIPAVFFTIVLTYVGAVALHPELVNVAIVTKSGGGEEAVGLLSFLAKTAIKVVPVVFCLLAIGGCLAVVASYFRSGEALANMIGEVLNHAYVPVPLPYGLAAAGVIAFAALVPMLAYFAFVLQYLALDLWRSVLSIPGKLDVLKKP